MDDDLTFICGDVIQIDDDLTVILRRLKLSTIGQ